MRKALLLFCLLGAFAWAQEAKKPDAPPAPPAPQAPAAPPAVNPLNPPQAVVPAETFDAGDVIKGKKVEHVFVIKNAGKSDLEILSAKPG